MVRELVFDLPNDLQCIEDAVEFVAARCCDCRVATRRYRLNFRVGLTEALSNAMIYGNGKDPSKQVRIQVTLGPDSLTARVTDQGDGFDPNRVEDPTLAPNIQRVGGRGIFLMRKLMDEVRFNDQGNSVTLVLYLAEEEELRSEATA